RMKKELMGVFLQEEAGATLKPLERSTPAGSIPQYWFDQLSSSVMTSSNTRLTKANPVLLQLSCELVLATDDKEVSVRLNLARIPSTTLLGKLKGSAAVEGGVLPSEKAFPVSLEEAVRNYPYVSFTLSGLTIKAWGKPIQNSAAAKIYEEYFKGLKERTEDAEKRLGQIHRDFMAELGQSNPLWKELSACKDTKFSGASKELVLAVDTGLRSGSDPFSSPQDKADFIANSKIKRVRPFLGILAPTMNHKGSFSLGGFDF
ncbi:MAG: hypothetical protein WCG75_10125, partial [Armatimonadota bacterium]